MRIEPEPDVASVRETLEDQSRCAQQDESERDLGDHEQIARAFRAGCFRAAMPARFQRELNISARRMPRRPQTEEHARHEGKRETEYEHPAIERHVLESWYSRRRQGD